MGNQACCQIESSDLYELKASIPLRIMETLEGKQFMQMYPLLCKTVMSTENYACELYSKMTRMPDGLYFGEMQSSKNFRDYRHGKGVMLFDAGFYYQGTWNKGWRTGFGFMADSSGDCYQGEWLNGYPHGQGIYMSYNKREFYRGNWQKGVMSGKGLEQFEDGSKYEGEFENGLKHGKGSLSFLDGTYYLGEFKKNKLGGYGVQEGVNFRYVGEWKDNIMHGTGRCDFFSDAKVLTESYIGQYDHGVRHGYGEYHWLNGQVYKGQWSQGAITGKGIFIRPTRTNLVRDP